jgi:pyruvate dehydrogenase E1 component alpha subunit
MPREKINFSIEKLSIIDENGKADKKVMPEISDDMLKKMYQFMVQERIMDDRILKLQREGRCGTYASCLGQEAVQVGASLAMQDDDWMFPYFRDLGSIIVRKFPVSQYLRYWMGDQRGMQVPDGQNNFMVCIPVGTQTLHAVGAAFALKARKEKSAVVVFFGDGATSEGDFHEAMNFAGVWKLPIVFVCQNNQYAISVPLRMQTASQTLAQKAIAYGFDGIQVDGNDVVSVYSAVRSALEKARDGKGPTFVECLTYRIGDHTTSDDASRYRSQGEVDAWKRKDPIERMKKFLDSKGIWSADFENNVRDDAVEKADIDVKDAESAQPEKLDEIFSFTYAQMPDKLKRQLDEARDGLQ